jgi:hypothetical protein
VGGGDRLIEKVKEVKENFSLFFISNGFWGFKKADEGLDMGHLE